VPSTESAHLLSNFDGSQLDWPPQYVPVLSSLSPLPSSSWYCMSDPFSTWPFYTNSTYCQGSDLTPPAGGSSLITPATPPRSGLWILQYLLDISKSSCSLNYQVWETAHTLETALVLVLEAWPFTMGPPKSVINVSDGQLLSLKKL